MIRQDMDMPKQDRGDISSISDIEEQDYQTDFTTPASSDSGPDAAQDEIEEFKDREYPQLKGKIYLDHGGTTVCDFTTF